MATPKEVVETQWLEWQEANPVHEHIDTEVLKAKLLENLTYASQMDVKE